MSKLKNIHPGEILYQEFILPLDLSQNKLARAINVSPRRINEIVLEKRSITADTDLRLSRFLGTSPGFWMNLQQDFDLEAKRNEMKETLKHIKPLKQNKNVDQ
jgi:addiction module HigA family antidote